MVTHTLQFTNDRVRLLYEYADIRVSAVNRREEGKSQDPHRRTVFFVRRQHNQHSCDRGKLPTSRTSIFGGCGQVVLSSTLQTSDHDRCVC